MISKIYEVLIRIAISFFLKKKSHWTNLLAKGKSRLIYKRDSMFKGDVIQEYQVEKWIKFLDCLEKSDVTDIVRIISIMPKALSAIFTHTFYAGYTTSDLVIYYNLVALSP